MTTRRFALPSHRFSALFAAPLTVTVFVQVEAVRTLMKQQRVAFEASTFRALIEAHMRCQQPLKAAAAFADAKQQGVRVSVAMARTWCAYARNQPGASYASGAEQLHTKLSKGRRDFRSSRQPLSEAEQAALDKLLAMALSAGDAAPVQKA